MRSTPRQKLGWGVANVVVLLIAAIPVLWLISLSFKDPSTLTDGSFYPKKWTFQNYRGIFDQPLFTHALVNSIGIAIIATVLGVAFGAMAAYAIARLDFPGKQLLIASALLIAMFPPIALVNPMFNLWREIGLKNK
jgi:multiple sugar transport system permease protein